jgi:hypothetical protein
MLRAWFSAYSDRLRQNAAVLVQSYQPAMFFLSQWKPPPRGDLERKEVPMKLLAAAAVALGLSLTAMTASQAMPLAPLDQAASADTIRVAGGCGPGWHRGPYGGCRPMFNCPPGWHSGPYGRRCFRNW